MKSTINPYQRSASWLAIAFLVIAILTIFTGNWDSGAWLCLGGFLGILIGMAWERSKH